ncbi:hypothetical protein [Nocardia terpenica]|uniref:Uncharacterized protein n=1 Tax=Nocardia terpenica TaxID=455432 RepID=A0A164K5K8_9NOCA|nr:hypothetical protein [Nocardia terpenica]KZM71055.1 hypothetical protein AWN90_41800 [Nocardia terpenica]NQE89627.1 hypothetical protein [Nocardia terpenica]
MPAILATAATFISAIAVALITYFGSRVPTLESQRSDFNAVLQPLRDELRELRERVGHLEAELRVSDRKYRLLIDYARRLLKLCPDPLPPVPPEIADDL